MPIDAIGGVDPFTGVRVIEINRARIAIGARRFGRGGREEKESGADRAGSENFAAQWMDVEEGFCRGELRADRTYYRITATPSRAHIQARYGMPFWQNKSPVLGYGVAPIC